MGLNPHARRPLPCLRYVPAVVVNLQLPRSWDRTNCAKVVLFRAVMAKNSIEILRSSSKPISWMVVYYQAQKIFKPCLTPLVTVHGHHPKALWGAGSKPACVFATTSQGFQLIVAYLFLAASNSANPIELYLLCRGIGHRLAAMEALPFLHHIRQYSCGICI